MGDQTTPEPRSKDVEARPLRSQSPSAMLFKKSILDVVLRVLLLAAAVASVVVMCTANQKKLITALLPTGTPITLYRTAKFDHSPAFIYFVAALSTVGLYSIITTLMSVSLKPASSARTILFLIIGDALMLGLVASAAGTAGGVAYIGLKGNSHVGWTKVCNVYDTFCHHVGGAVAVSLFAGVVLVVLVIRSVSSIRSSLRK